MRPGFPKRGINIKPDTPGCNVGLAFPYVQPLAGKTGGYQRNSHIADEKGDGADEGGDRGKRNKVTCNIHDTNSL